MTQLYEILDSLDTRFISFQHPNDLMLTAQIYFNTFYGIYSTPRSSYIFNVSQLFPWFSFVFEEIFLLPFLCKNLYWLMAAFLYWNRISLNYHRYSWKVYHGVIDIVTHIFVDFTCTEKRYGFVHGFNFYVWMQFEYTRGLLERNCADLFSCIYKIQFAHKSWCGFKLICWKYYCCYFVSCIHYWVILYHFFMGSILSKK